MTVQDIVSAHIERYSAEAGASRLLPKFIYHFTDINNAISILRQKRLVSRVIALDTGAMQTDNAAACVINGTAEDYQRCVRFYFGPRTPTQFRNEGIRPPGERYENAHCPVPIFFAFDKLITLLRADVRVSDGNVASHNAKVGTVEEVFPQIPFEKVFHRGFFDRDENPGIIFHRHAEVLIQDSINLDEGLVWLGCRSNAERQTLLHLLGSELASEYITITRVCDGAFFEKRWIFVERVEFSGVIIKFFFNPNSSYRGDATIRLEVDYPAGASGAHTFQVDLSHGSWSVRLPFAYEWVIVRMYIFDCLAYAGRLSSAELL